MEIEEALVEYLLGIISLTDLIDKKLYPDEIPQGVKLPAVIYLKSSDVKEHTLEGQSQLESPMFQFSVFADTKSKARGISNILKEVLCDYQGTMSGIDIQYIRLENELSNLETSSDGTIRVYTETLEFEINYIRR